MPKSKYQTIYKDLKEKIETGIFPRQELLPSENTLIQDYDCSRNTVRRAISHLASDGYVQARQGKGVRNIYQPVEQASFTLGEIESFRESARRNKQVSKTKVVLFTELIADTALARRTGFPEGTPVLYLQRLHYLDGKALILNHNYFRKDQVPGLTPEIGEQSIYRYLEEDLHMVIVNSRRIMTVEKITQIDEKYLELNAEDYNCLAVVTSSTYNSDGIMFEFTQSRHRPDYFRFQDNAVRHGAGITAM